jgi:DNA polymerase-3 subunit alpha
VEWWASVLQNSSKDDLKANARYCSKYISPPDVMVSQIDVFVADRTARSDRGRIVFPLSMVHGVKSAALAVVAARPFSSLEEMYEKVDKKVVNKRVFAALIWSGAMDAMFGIDPETDGISGRNLLYMRYLEIKRDKEPFERLSELELMKRQGAAFPMIEPDYAAKISQMTDRNIQCVSAVASRPPGSRISVGGVIREIKAFPTKKGDEMSRMKVCNGDSTAEITVFPDLHSEISGLAKAGDLVIMKGRTQDWQGRRSLVADEARFPENE